MICPKCQKENLEGAKFCAFCGTPMVTQEVQSSVQPPVPTPIQPEVSVRENSGVPKKTIMVISLIIILIGMVVVFLDSNMIGGLFIIIPAIASLIIGLISKERKVAIIVLVICSILSFAMISYLTYWKYQVFKSVRRVQNQMEMIRNEENTENSNIEKQTLERAPTPEVQTIKRAPTPEIQSTP